MSKDKSDPLNKFSGFNFLYKEDIILWDFDAYDHRYFNYDYINVLENEYMKMGHAFVLAMCLEIKDIIDELIKENERIS